jgi:hypothetical protein
MGLHYYPKVRVIFEAAITAQRTSIMNADVFTSFTRIFSTVLMDFSALATNNSYEKVRSVALSARLFL